MRKIQKLRTFQFRLTKFLNSVAADWRVLRSAEASSASRSSAIANPDCFCASSSTAVAAWNEETRFRHVCSLALCTAGFISLISLMAILSTACCPP